MMKRALVRFVCGAAVMLGLMAASAAPASAQGAQGNSLGVGIILGEPSGLTLKQWLNASNAFDVHLAFDFTDEAVAAFADYLYHFDIFRLKSSTSVELPVYVGIGGKLLIDADSDKKGDNDDTIAVGVRIPVGLSVLLKQAPLEIFIEIAPGVRIIPRTTGDVDGGLGVRYYF